MNLKSIAVALALCACQVPAFAAADNISGNPVFPGWYADPEAVKFGDEYWIYPTTSIPFDQQTSFDAFSSKNLKDWKRHPQILTTDSVSWARRAMWAPAVIAANGKYYMFFSANDVHEGEVGGIGVAVSDNPAGPFTDAIGHPLIGEIVNGAQPIDQFVFRDVDGQYYMYYGGWSHCNMVKLSPDLLSLEPFDDGQYYKEVTPKNYVEGPFMFIRDGKYIFMWSEGNWTKDTYRVAYAIADSPFGPFRREGVILESDPDVATGAGHHSVIKGNGDDEYYIVYHRHPLGATDGNNRVTCIDRMYFDKSGKIRPIKMTFDGIEAVSVTDPVMDAFITDLMSRMTLEEKLGQLNLLTSGQVMTGPTFNADVEEKIASGGCGALLNLRGVGNIRPLQEAAVTKSRLGIPMIFGFDMIHGYSTIYPIPLALSCTWDMDIIEQTARLTAKEATADGIDWDYSPMVDICRDPRWGRVAEGAGEDPYLGSRIAEAYIRGYQGKNLADKEHLMACVKHFACYGASEAGRDYNTVDMSRQMMYNYYLPPYRAAAQAGAASFMSSFNLVDFVPATANKWLLTDVLRKQWGFNGFVVTDYSSIREMVTHGMGNIEECAARALKAGTDMDMVSEAFVKELPKALAKGDVSIGEIDAAVRRVLEAKYKLGLFDDPYKRLDSKRAASDLNTPEALAAARQAAVKSFVLLKNDGNVLPLKKKRLKIAVVGPCADTRQNLRGAWAGTGDMSKCPTILEEIRRVAGDENVVYALGAHFSDNPRTSGPLASIESNLRGNETADELIAEALEAARNADVIVAAVGEAYDFSGEGASMADIQLQKSQQMLLKALKDTGKPIVMLNFAGRPNILSWEDENLDAILNVWFGGSQMAPAITDVLFGDVAPSGKTTMTFPRSVGQIPLYYNHMHTGRPQPAENDEYIKYKSNYIDISNTPLYPFGYGLSYTTFEYSDFRLSSDSLNEHGVIKATVKVTNTGNCDATEIAQLYISDPEASLARPVKELKGFRRFDLKTGESKTIEFTITVDDLKFFNYDLDYVAEPGQFQVTVGTNSRDTLTPLSFTFTPAE